MKIEELPALPDGLIDNVMAGGVNRPFRRTVRQLVDGSFRNSGNGDYVIHDKFAIDAWHYKRAFQIIDSEISQIFNYIEPAFQNLESFSYKISGLLTKICIEIEANFKAILAENAYPIAPSKLNMAHYCKVERSHFLSKYWIKFAVWHGQDIIFQPFASWTPGEKARSPDWYQAYNASKHDRHSQFASAATFRNMLEAYCALSLLIWTQFFDASSPGPVTLSLGSTGGLPGFTFGPMHRTLIRLPEIATTERYDFNWQAIKELEDPFQNFAF